MKKELNELTEEQARKIVDLVAGREFVSFSCDEAALKSDGFFRVRIKMDNNYLLFIFSSGNIFLMDKGSILQPLNTLYIIDYLRCQGFYFENKFEKKVVINNNNRLEMIKNYFNNISEEKLAEFTEIAKKYSDIGPTVEEYLSQFPIPKNFLELIKSGKIEKTEGMAFSREGFSGHKLIDDPNLNFNLIEVNTKTSHRLKKVEEGIRIYRILDGYGAFYIQENSIVENNEVYFEVKYDDVILIKAGDSYRYEKGLGNKLNLFEINIKYP